MSERSAKCRIPSSDEASIDASICFIASVDIHSGGFLFSLPNGIPRILLHCPEYSGAVIITYRKNDFICASLTFFVDTPFSLTSPSHVINSTTLSWVISSMTIFDTSVLVLAKNESNSLKVSRYEEIVFSP